MTDRIPSNESLEIFRRMVNRLYTDGDAKFRKKIISDLHLTLENIMPIINEWQRLGYVQIVNTTDCLFEVKDEIPENWKR